MAISRQPSQPVAEVGLLQRPTGYGVLNWLTTIDH